MRLSQQYDTQQDNPTSVLKFLRLWLEREEIEVHLCPTKLLVPFQTDKLVCAYLSWTEEDIPGCGAHLLPDLQVLAADSSQNLRNRWGHFPPKQNKHLFNSFGVFGSAPLECLWNAWLIHYSQISTLPLHRWRCTLTGSKDPVGSLFI